MTAKRKFGLLASLDGGAPTKQKFQIFEAEIGFEKFEVTIPYSKADDFETAANSKKPQTLAALQQLVKEFGGNVSK